MASFVSGCDAGHKGEMPAPNDLKVGGTAVRGEVGQHSDVEISLAGIVPG